MMLLLLPEETKRDEEKKHSTFTKNFDHVDLILQNFKKRKINFVKYSLNSLSLYFFFFFFFSASLPFDLSK